MKIFVRLLVVTIFCSTILTVTALTLKMASLYDFKLKDMAGVEQSLSKYHGKIVLLENVASL
jgi:Glutathione peroxidase